MKTISNEKTDINKMSQKSMRKFLNTLPPSTAGKENLVGADRTPQDMEIDRKTLKPEQTFVQTEECSKEMSSVAKTDPSYVQFLTEDLTSEAGPSEKYWEVISERRKKALLKALEEYQRLQALVIALEEENLSLAILFDNTTNLVNSLKKMVSEIETSDDDNKSSDGQKDSGLSTPDSYSSVKHIHKKMKISPDDCSDSD